MVSIYGVDLKQQPDGTVKAIEINGVDSGTDFFKNPEWHDYYFRFMNALGEAVQGKPIFIEFHQDSVYTATEVEKETLRTWGKYGNLRHKCRRFRDSLDPVFWFNDTWLDDVEQFEIDNLTKPPEDEVLYYVAAGRRLGLQVVPFTRYWIKGDQFRFKDSDGIEHRIAKRDIGCLWVKSSSLEYLAQHYPQHTDIYVNNALAERIAASKVLFHTLITDFGNGLAEMLPPTTLFGLGTYTPETFEMLKQGAYVVRKQSGGSCGVGVDILRNQEILQLFGASYKYNYERIRESVITLLKESVHFELEEFVEVYQPFIPSKPIYAQRTKAYHDGCARGVVISPGYQDPIWIGGQWRLAPQPSGTDTPLNEQYRANLSRGAIPQPLTPEEDAAMKPFAEGFIQKYEEVVMRYWNGAQFHPHEKYTRSLATIRWLFWTMKLLRFIEKDHENEVLRQAFNGLLEYDPVMSGTNATATVRDMTRGEVRKYFGDSTSKK